MATNAVAAMVAAIDAAEAQALAEHRAGVCDASEWACSHCEAEAAPTSQTG